MKELSIEEKARRFDEVLAMAKECITYIPDDAVVKYMLNMFPELKESEDERIKNVLIGWINLEPSISFNDTFDGFSKEQILAWLEKQGENHIVNNNEMVKNVEVIKEEKVDNADKVELMSLDEAIKHCNEKSCRNNACALEHKQIEKWLTELKEIKEQNHVWGEDDEMRYINLIRLVKYSSENDVTKESFINFINKLKSFKDRYTWKPSDEQMNALDSTMQYSQVSPNFFMYLNSLFNDLMKLREG